MNTTRESKKDLEKRLQGLYARYNLDLFDGQLPKYQIVVKGEHLTEHLKLISLGKKNKNFPLTRRMALAETDDRSQTIVINPRIPDQAPCSHESVLVHEMVHVYLDHGKSEPVGHMEPFIEKLLSVAKILAMKPSQLDQRTGSLLILELLGPQAGRTLLASLYDAPSPERAGR